jgi:hypothetical protein
MLLGPTTTTRLLSAALALALAACQKSPPPAPPPPAPEAPQVAAAGAPAYVTQVSALRREPADAPRVKGPAGKEVSNVLATLQRGERVTVLEGAARIVGQDEWAHVRSSDDQDGWMRRTALLEGDGVREATVLVPADVFDRPDLLAANARRRIEPGTLLLVVREKAPFAEVNVSSGPNAWVLADRLATGAPEVSVAKLAEKGRWLRRAGKPDEALKLVALARATFPGVALVEQVAVELGEAPAVPPGGEVVPAAGEAPATPAPAYQDRRPDDTP